MSLPNSAHALTKRNIKKKLKLRRLLGVEKLTMDEIVAPEKHDEQQMFLQNDFH